MLTKDQLNQLASHSPQPFAGERPAYLGQAKSRPASVLLLFAEGKDGLEILLTKRAAHLRIHAGQVSFPGGKPEPEDASPAITALRETEEETGLSAELISVQGYLPPVLTNTNYLVDLTIGFCDRPAAELQASLQPAPEEVDLAWFAPIAPLVQLDYFEQHQLVKQGEVRKYWQIRGSDPIIWGATAAMLRQLAVRVDKMNADQGKEEGICRDI